MDGSYEERSQSYFENFFYTLIVYEILHPIEGYGSTMICYHSNNKLWKRAQVVY